MFKVIVCGGRDYAQLFYVGAIVRHDTEAARNRALQDQKAMDIALGKVSKLAESTGRKLQVITGGAPGADRYAYCWAMKQIVANRVFHADWGRHGKAAGPMRNQAMLSHGADLVVAFPGGRGTADMTRRAETAKVPVWRPVTGEEIPKLDDE